MRPRVVATRYRALLASVRVAGRSTAAITVVAAGVDATQHPVTIALSTTIVPRHGSHHVVVHGAGHGAGQAVAHGSQAVVTHGSQQTVTHGS